MEAARRNAQPRHASVDRFPPSGLAYGFGMELVGLGKSPIKPALAVLGTAEVPALVMEELADGRCLVFVPASPKPSQGFLHVPASMSILSMQVITRLLRATGGRHDEDAPTGGKVRITRSRRR